MNKAQISQPTTTKKPSKIIMQIYGGGQNPWGLVLRVDTQEDR